jgi:hypothetical protein
VSAPDVGTWTEEDRQLRVLAEHVHQVGAGERDRLGGTDAVVCGRDCAAELCISATRGLPVGQEDDTTEALAARTRHREVDAQTGRDAGGDAGSDVSRGAVESVAIREREEIRAVGCCCGDERRSEGDSVMERVGGGDIQVREPAHCHEVARNQAPAGSRRRS